MTDNNHIHKWIDTDVIYYTCPLLRRQECDCGESKYVEVPDSGIRVVKMSAEEFKQYILKKGLI